MEAEMDCNVIATSQPLTNVGSSQGQFNLKGIDETGLNKQSSIREAQDQQVQEYKLGDLDGLLEQVELTKSRHKNGLNLSISTDVRAFSIFGPSVFLYFEFMRKIIILLVLLSLVSLIPIVYNAVKGEAYSTNAFGVTAALAKTTIGAHIPTGNNQNTAKIINITVLTFNIAILLAFWIYWKKITLEESNKIQRELGLANYGGIVIEMVEGNFEENQLILFLGKFGNIEEIQKVKDFKDALYLGKKVHESMKKNKFLEYLLSQDVSRYEQLMGQIQENRLHIEKLNNLLVEQLKKVRDSEQKVLRYFVKYEDHEAQRLILKTFSDYEGCCAKSVPQELHVGNKKIKVVRQQCQPYETNWQNQSINWKQTTITNILLLIFINLFVIAGLIIIALLLASTRPVYYQPSLPSNSFNYSTIAASGNQTLVDSWCLGAQPHIDNKELCQPVYDLYGIRMVITVAIGTVLLLSRFVVKRVVYFFRPYLRFKDKVEQSKEVTMHLFINYSIISIVIALCLQTNLFSSAIVSIFISCLQHEASMSQHLTSLLQYSDYTSQWYLQYGFQLMVNFFIMALFPHCITPLFQLIMHKIKLYKASKEKYEILMKEELQLVAFELEDHYASMLFVLLAGFIFAGGMPLLIPILLITLIVKYFATKYLFLHLNQPPAITDRTLANKIPPIFLFIITVYLLNSIWAFGVQSVFASQSSLFNDRGINAESNAHNPFEALLVFLRRVTNTWQPVIVYIIGAIIIIIRKLLLKVYSSYANQSSNLKHHEASPPDHEDRRDRHLQVNNGEIINKSYKLQANKEYHDILDYINTLNY